MTQQHSAKIVPIRPAFAQEQKPNVISLTGTNTVNKLALEKDIEDEVVIKKIGQRYHASLKKTKIAIPNYYRIAMNIRREWPIEMYGDSADSAFTLLQHAIRNSDFQTLGDARQDNRAFSRDILVFKRDDKEFKNFRKLCFYINNPFRKLKKHLSPNA